MKDLIIKLADNEDFKVQKDYAPNIIIGLLE